MPSAGSDGGHCADKTIADNFARCESGAQGKARKKRESSLNQLKRADGVRPMFSRQSRQQLPRGVYDRILETNWMDVAMHKLALELSDGLIEREEQKAPLPVR